MSTQLASRLLIGFLALACGSQAYADLRIWTTAETRHILRSDPPGSTLGVRFAAARNECRSFQILLRSDGSVGGIRIEPADLQGPGGAMLPAQDAQLYRQHQAELTVGTYRNDQFKPDWYPDALIPFRHPISREPLAETRLVAVPFDLPANQTHGFWVDIPVPADAKPGVYRGSYQVTAPGQTPTQIPVELTVWDFALPAVPTFVTAFGSPADRMRSYYAQRAKEGKEPAPKDWAAVETECAQLLSEHQVNATPSSEMLRPKAQSDGSFRIPTEQVRRLREFVDRYHVNALETPHPSSVVKDPELERDKLRAWLAAFNEAAKLLDRPQVVFFTYLKDEPNTLEDYRYVQKWGRAVRDAKSVVKVMVVEQTWTAPGQGGADSAWGDLYEAVDIWCPLFSLHRQDSAAQRQSQGEMIWTYTALCQGQPTPWWHTDYPLLNYRVPAWIAWHYRMTGLLYWGGMSYWREVDDPWVQAPIYTGNGAFQQGRRGIVFNGEGSLVYPARAVGFDGIAPSLRLKALRDSINDYEYLAILQRLGKAADAEKIIAPLAQSFFAWDKDPSAYDLARAKLAKLIVSSTPRQRD
ncbi:MAG: glycoside hydrolase domain-containing protein [Bacillota bacterium]